MSLATRLTAVSDYVALQRLVPSNVGVTAAVRGRARGAKVPYEPLFVKRRPAKSSARIDLSKALAPLTRHGDTPIAAAFKRTPVFNTQARA